MKKSGLVDENPEKLTFSGIWIPQDLKGQFSFKILHFYGFGHLTNK